MKKSFLKYAVLFLSTILLISNNTCKKSTTSSDNGDSNNPEINIKVADNTVANGTGSYDFGNVNVGGTSTAISFTIENLGDAILTLSGTPTVAVLGNDSDMFTVTLQPGTSIVEGSSSNFSITFNPTTEGNKTATVSIVNDDTDKNPYIFTITGVSIDVGYNSTEIAQNFQALANIPTTSTVIFTGPVEPGTIIKSDELDGTDEAELVIPSTNGTYFVFIIDDEPDMRFAHDMRYAWYNIDNDAFELADALMPATILRPNIDPSPFTVIENIDVNGVQYSYASGEGKAEGGDVSHKNNAETLVKISATQFRVQREPKKWAFVVDAGERSGSNRFHELEGALLSAWTESEGFSTYHTSQSPRNSQDGYASAAGIISYIGSVGTLLTSLGEPECGCDEFFIYIGAHGQPYFNSAGVALSSSVALYTHGPGGVTVSWIRYGELYQTIKNNFPSYAKVTFVVDACYSGRAIADHTAIINEICNNICALTVLTSCKATVKTSTPLSGGIRSGTQMFIAGANLDHDGDGINGDIKDRFAEMQGRQTTLQSQSFHCPEGGSWCSLDSPPPPEEIATCTGVTHYSGYSKIKVCIKYCYAEGHTVDIALYGPSPGTASIPVVNGEACHEFTINWYGDYTWTATLNPGGLPSTGFIQVDANSVPCNY